MRQLPLIVDLSEAIKDPDTVTLNKKRISNVTEKLQEAYFQMNIQIVSEMVLLLLTIKTRNSLKSFMCALVMNISPLLYLVHGFVSRQIRTSLKMLMKNSWSYNRCHHQKIRLLQLCWYRRMSLSWSWRLMARLVEREKLDLMMQASAPSIQLVSRRRGAEGT